MGKYHATLNTERLVLVSEAPKDGKRVRVWDLTPEDRAWLRAEWEASADDFGRWIKVVKGFESGNGSDTIALMEGPITVVGLYGDGFDRQ